jgi:hypothetical protein
VDAGFDYEDEETRALFHDAVAEMPEHGKPLMRLTVTDDLLLEQQGGNLPWPRTHEWSD